MTPSASAPDSRSTALRATPSVDDGRPKQPVASAGDGRLAVSQAGPSIDDAWTKPSHGVSASSAAAAAAASQRSSPSVAIGNKVAGSSAAFQSPLDQILVDQRRMFERTATYNAATSRTPANVQQFSSHPMSQQKKLSPSDAVAQVTRAASPPPVQQPLLASASRPTVASSNVGPMSSAASAETPESIQSSDKTQALNSTPHASRSSTASGTSPTESDNSGHSEGKFD